MLNYKAITLLCTGVLAAQSQTLQVHSIVSSRGQNSNSGYTLDGPWMASSARLKLLNTANFGASGTYSKTIQITDGYGGSGSLTQVTGLPYNDIFFLGGFDKLDPNLAVFTGAEVDSLYRWSKRGGKMIISSGQFCPPQAQPYPFDSRIIDLKWGIFWDYQVPGYFIPTTGGNATDIFNGPFGSCTGAYQGGTIQGYLDTSSSNCKVLARNPDGKATLIMDCNTLDLITADVDGYTSLGGLSSNASVMTDQDKFWANTIVFMDRLQPPPKLSYLNNSLGLNASYVNYQWYLNNQPVAGAVAPGHVPSQSGTYYAEVTLNGGCRLKSDMLYVTANATGTDDPSAFATPGVFPNPFSTGATVRFYAAVLNATVSLSDALGRTVWTRNVSGEELVIARDQLAAGIYILSVAQPGASVRRARLVID